MSLRSESTLNKSVENFVESYPKYQIILSQLITLLSFRYNPNFNSEGVLEAIKKASDSVRILEKDALFEVGEILGVKLGRNVNQNEAFNLAAYILQHRDLALEKLTERKKRIDDLYKKLKSINYS